MSNLRREIDIKIAEIKKWDKQNIHALASLFEELDNAMFDLGESENWIQHYEFIDFGLDITSLPTYDIPVSACTFPVWAMDKDNNCLVEFPCSTNKSEKIIYSLEGIINE